MRAVGAAVHPGALDPSRARCVRIGALSHEVDYGLGSKDVGTPIRRSRVQPVLQRGASLLRDFELNRAAGLALDDCRPVSHVSADGDVIDPKDDEIADRMNLGAKEFLAAQDPDDPGVLMLSQFAGAAVELDEALIVNPHETDAVAAALKRALEMPGEERRERHAPMLHIS